MLIRLRDATPENAGVKAATLGHLAKAGFPVPPGFVVPVDTYQSIVDPLDIPTVLTQHGLDEVRRLIEAQPLPPQLLTELTEALTSLGDLPVAVRSSATTEDTPHASAAGQHDTYLAIHGPHAVATKFLATWSSLWSPRATAYHQPLAPPPTPPATLPPTAPTTPPAANSSHARSTLTPVPGITLPVSSPTSAMAVLVQRHIDAEVAGVLFTAGFNNASDPGAGEMSVIEASWGLGESVVQGLVTPDEFVVGTSGLLEVRLGDKRTRIDRGPGGTLTSEVPDEARWRACLSDDQVQRLRKLGEDVAGYLGSPQDIEFAVENDHIWLLQARPVTANLAVTRQERTPVEPRRHPGDRRPNHPGDRRPCHPGSQVSPEADAAGLVLHGTAGSAGIAVGPARIVAGPGDFAKVAVGDILVCRFTDPAWTALFAVIAGVVTETGGRLSHAAIVARERRIPAVLGVSSVLTSVEDGQHLTVDGTIGTVRFHRPTQSPTA